MQDNLSTAGVARAPDQQWQHTSPFTLPIVLPPAPPTPREYFQTARRWVADRVRGVIYTDDLQFLPLSRPLSLAILGQHVYLFIVHQGVSHVLSIEQKGNNPDIVMFAPVDRLTARQLHYITQGWPLTLDSIVRLTVGTIPPALPGQRWTNLLGAVAELRRLDYHLFTGRTPDHDSGINCEQAVTYAVQVALDATVGLGPNANRVQRLTGGRSDTVGALLVNLTEGYRTARSGVGNAAAGLGGVALGAAAGLGGVALGARDATVAAARAVTPDRLRGALRGAVDFFKRPLEPAPAEGDGQSAQSAPARPRGRPRPPSQWQSSSGPWP